MRKGRKLTSAEWEQVRVAYFAGTGLREIARRMGIPEGTVLARAKRENWSEKLANALAPVQSMQSLAITPAQSVAESLADLGHKSRLSLAKGLHKGAGHVESLTGAEVLENAQEVASLTKAGNQLHGWQNALATGFRLDVVAACVGVQIEQPTGPEPDLDELE
jgi:uncharacterized protein YjcR